MTSAPPLASRCVLVLGMHRSGTSVLARALIALGVDFGSRLLVGRADNPKGFFEDAEAYAVNEAFLKNLGCSWHSLLLPDSVSDELAKTYQDDIRNKILAKFIHAPLWGLKEPRITQLLPHWQTALREAEVSPIYLLANRHPFSVADSLTRRDGLPEAQSLALWAMHQLNGLEALAAHGGLVVDYDKLMASPRREVERLAGFLGIPLENRQTEVDQFTGEFLQADLRHAQYTEHTEATTPLQVLCLDIHRLILGLAALPGGVADGQGNHIQRVMIESRERLKSMAEWMSALDALHAAQFAQLDKAKQERELLIQEKNKAQAQLEWLESRLPIRLYKQVKTKLQDFAGKK